MPQNRMDAAEVVQQAELVKEVVNSKKIPVVEIFGPTIQGEGPLAGSKTMFVRTGGCDYRCTKCDSLHAVIPSAVKKHAERLTQEEIFDRLYSVMQKTGTRWVTLSGGNPCMWDLTELVQELKYQGCKVAVETQGTLHPDWLTKCDLVVVSPKSPGMGERFETNMFSRFLDTFAETQVPVALKVVVFSQQDIEFALFVGELATDRLGVVKQGMRFMSLGNPHPPYLHDGLELVNSVTRPILLEHLMREYRQLIEEVTNDRRIDDWKFLPQLHVLAFGNDTGR